MRSTLKHKFSILFYIAFGAHPSAFCSIENKLIACNNNK